MESGVDLRRERKATMMPIAFAFPVAIALWFGMFYGLPPLPGGFGLALKCTCVAALFCLAAGVEAVAHERLTSPAIDPLSGYETRRMEVNRRYLQNTLEQFALFAAGLFGLTLYLPDGRAVAATTVVWIVARMAFWIGYHRGSAQRAFGAPGLLLSILVLLYVCARFGYELAGTAGAIAPVVLFLALEAVLFWGTTRPHRN